VQYDEAGCLSTANDNYTCQAAGLYLVSGVYRTNGSASFLVLQIFINGAATVEGDVFPLGNGTGTITVVGQMNLNATDTIDLRVYNFSGGGTGTGGASLGSGLPRMSVHRIGPKV
jgi:hypothetical protein